MRLGFIFLCLIFLFPSSAKAQCIGVFPEFSVCGTNNTTAAPPTAVTNRVIFANDFGAVCDGVTDDHVAFQNAINAVAGRGYPVRFRGDCALSTGLSITSSVDFGGLDQLTDALLCAPGITCITVDTDSRVFLHDMTVTYSSTPHSGDTAIIITSTAGGHTQNGNSQLWRLIVGGYHGINFANADAWTLRDSDISVSGGDGLIVANTFAGDNGSETAYGNQISSTVSGGNAVHWKSSGGFRFTNNVIIGTGFNAGFLIDLASGLATSDIWITNNHIEGFASTGAAGVQIQRNGSTATLGNLVITSNEIAGADVAIYEVLDGTGQWLNNVTIGDNVMGTSGNAAAVNYCIELLTAITGLSIHHGSCNGVSGAANNNVVVKLGTQTATNCAVGPIPHQGGTFAASTLSSCTSYTPD